MSRPQDPKEIERALCSFTEVGAVPTVGESTLKLAYSPTYGGTMIVDYTSAAVKYVPDLALPSAGTIVATPLTAALGTFMPTDVVWDPTRLKFFISGANASASTKYLWTYDPATGTKAELTLASASTTSGSNLAFDHSSGIIYVFLSGGQVVAYKPDGTNALVGTRSVGLGFANAAYNGVIVVAIDAASPTIEYSLNGGSTWTTRALAGSAPQLDLRWSQTYGQFIWLTGTECKYFVSPSQTLFDSPIARNGSKAFQALDEWPAVTGSLSPAALPSAFDVGCVHECGFAGATTKAIYVAPRLSGPSRAVGFGLPSVSTTLVRQVLWDGGALWVITETSTGSGSFRMFRSRRTFRGMQ